MTQPYNMFSECETSESSRKKSVIHLHQRGVSIECLSELRIRFDTLLSSYSCLNQVAALGKPAKCTSHFLFNQVMCG